MKIKVLKEGIHTNHKPTNKNIKFEVNPICSSVTLIRGDKNILVDTGYYGFEDEIIDALKKEGLEPNEIDFIINTHCHFDHCANNYLFNKAVKISGTCIWYDDKRVEVYRKQGLMHVPGVEIIETHGHLIPHISVVVKTDKIYVIAGDSVNEQIIRKGMYNDINNKEMVINSIKKIFSIADVIIPGHGRIIKGKNLEELKKKIDKLQVK